MRIRPLLAIAAGATALTLCLGGCSSPLDRLQEGLEEITEQLEDIDTTIPDATESDEDGEKLDEIALPSGFPAELPLPDGTLVQAFRTGKNFVLAHDGNSTASIEAMIEWFAHHGWELKDDVEIPPARSMAFGSPETNDYGHLRTVTFGYNMNDGSSSYALEVQED